MRSEYLFFSGVVVVWAAVVSAVGAWLSWSQDAIFIVGMLIVPVVILVWGHRDEVKARDQHREHPASSR